MKLYYSPGACSMASRITFHELGVDANYEKVDLKTKQTETGQDFRAVNPLGYVPAVALGDGRTLIENGAILPYLASLKPGTLAPSGDPLAEAQLHQWLGFLSSELHKAVGVFFGNPEGEARDAALTKLRTRLDYLERHLSDGRLFLLGDSFSVADAYAFVILSWTAHFDISLVQWGNITAFFERVRSRPSVEKALADEGLLETADA